MRAAIDRLELPNPRWAAVADVADLVAFGEDDRLAGGAEDAPRRV